MFLIALAAAAARPTAKVPSYPEAIRCAGLMEAGLGGKDPVSEEGRRLFDAALYWGLAASGVGRRGHVTATKFKADQVAAKTAAVADLGAGKAGGEFANCLKRVPPLK